MQADAVPPSHAATPRARAEAFRVGSRFFTLIVQGTDDAGSEETARRFFDSFRVRGKVRAMVDRASARPLPGPSTPDLVDYHSAGAIRSELPGAIKHLALVRARRTDRRDGEMVLDACDEDASLLVTFNEWSQGAAADQMLAGDTPKERGCFLVELSVTGETQIHLITGRLVAIFPDAPRATLPPRNVVYQVPGAAELFQQVGPKPLQLQPDEAVLLLCRIVVTGHFDLASAADINLSLQVGSTSGFFAAPDNRNVATFSMPAIRLRAGDRVAASASDRDAISRDDPIGDAEVSFDGELPLRMESEAMRIECRALSGKRLQQSIARQLAASDRRIAEARRAHAAPTALLSASQSIERLASVVGSADPRVQERDLRLLDLEVRWPPRRHERSP
jgi:hypothetical protein